MEFMLIEIIRQMMYGERSTVTTISQDKKAITLDGERNVMDDEDKPVLDPELELLVEKYGPLKDDQTVEMTLQEALQIWPRERKRSDAYKGLIKKAKEKLNVDLKIGGRKNG